MTRALFYEGSFVHDKKKYLLIAWHCHFFILRWDVGMLNLHIVIVVGRLPGLALCDFFRGFALVGFSEHNLSLTTNQ